MPQIASSASSASPPAVPLPSITISAGRRRARVREQPQARAHLRRALEDERLRLQVLEQAAHPLGLDVLVTLGRKAQDRSLTLHGRAILRDRARRARTCCIDAGLAERPGATSVVTGAREGMPAARTRRRASEKRRWKQARLLQRVLALGKTPGR